MSSIVQEVVSKFGSLAISQVRQRRWLPELLSLTAQSRVTRGDTFISFLNSQGKTQYIVST